MVLFMIKPGYSKNIAIRHQITVCMLFYMLEITSQLFGNLYSGSNDEYFICQVLDYTKTQQCHCMQYDVSDTV